ncbi:unnamed protein product, partial [Didymodactylos carnosus]
MKAGNNIWKVVNNTFKKSSPSFRGLRSTTGIEKDSDNIVNVLADFYENHFSLPTPDLNNTHHSKSLEEYTALSYTPNIPLDKISLDDVIKQWKKFKPKKSLN